MLIVEYEYTIGEIGNEFRAILEVPTDADPSVWGPLIITGLSPKFKVNGHADITMTVTDGAAGKCTARVDNASLFTKPGTYDVEVHVTGLPAGEEVRFQGARLIVKPSLT